MIEQAKDGYYVNRTGYGVMKLGNKPSLKGEFSALSDKHFEKVDSDRKYGKRKKSSMKSKGFMDKVRKATISF